MTLVCIFVGMKGVLVVVCIISLSFSTANAQSKLLSNGFKAVSQKNYGIAFEVFHRLAPKHQSLCAYGKTLLYSDSKEFYALDSALFLCA